MLNKLSVIPMQAYWLVIGTLLLALGAQQIHVAGLRTDVAAAGTALALEQKARSAETTARSLAALAHGKQISALQSEHAAQTLTKENEYAQEIKKWDALRVADAVVADRLRNRINAFAASDRRAGETDAIAVQRYADRLGVVSRLLVESVDLVVESRAVIGQRDLEVGRLLGQIRIDRVACTAPAGVSGMLSPE